MIPAPPVVRRFGSDDSAAPIIVLLHGRGSDESSMLPLADHLPAGPRYLALRGPLEVEPQGYTWFANRGLGQAVPESLALTMAWFREWLDAAAAPECPVVLVGFSGGAAFAAGLLLSDPDRYRAAALICGTVPWEAGVPTGNGRLRGASVFCAMGERDEVMPPDLMAATWQYLAERSGAASVMHRDPGGHEITAATAAALSGWLAEEASGC